MVTERRKCQIEAVLAQRLNGLVVVCEDFANPHNAAAVLRTCEAMGVLNIYIVEERAPTDLSRQVSAGAEKWINVHRFRRVKAAFEQLRGAGYRIVAATPEQGATVLDQLPFADRLALVFGNEGEGVSPQALSLADGTFTIPMHGFVPSLNVSAAAAIAVYHWAQRLREAHSCGDLTPNEIDALRNRYLHQSQEGYA